MGWPCLSSKAVVRSTRCKLEGGTTTPVPRTPLISTDPPTNPPTTDTMGLDVKEKALLQFIAKVTVPLALVLGPLAAYTGVWEHPLWVLGAFTAVVQAVKLTKYLLERATRRPKRVTAYGQWAIVTGASRASGRMHDLLSPAHVARALCFCRIITRPTQTHTGGTYNTNHPRPTPQAPRRASGRPLRTSWRSAG